MRRAHKLKVQAIQKEQMQLVKIEKSLEELLGNINESINTLKVEELQLKSSLVELYTASGQNDEQPTPSTSKAIVATAIDTPSTTLAAIPAIPNTPADQDVAIDESINKQLLDLESLLVPMKKRTMQNTEEEEEEEEDEEFVPE
ncbi:uncharacterized protein [Musca autumnalis]|uniref:uncharacterized protein n=1 Tax=Musca autumnalis TaxID=221902 RepID=UPI003CF32565